MAMTIKWSQREIKGKKAKPSRHMEEGCKNPFKMDWYACVLYYQGEITAFRKSAKK